MGIKHGTPVRVRRIIAYLVLFLMTFLCLIWFYILFINATRSNGELSRGFSLLPGRHFAENFHNMLHSTQPVVRGMLNSLLVAGSCAVLSPYFSAMTAHAVHAYHFKGRRAVYTIILAIMMIPTQVTALGFVDLLTKMNLMNNYLGLILPSIASPAAFFYMKQYMDAVLTPSLIEAARMDGAGEFRIFHVIVLPLMKPAIAVQAILTFVANWNNYFTPALVLKKEELKTLPILIAQLRSADFLKFDMGVVYMTIAFAIFPVIYVYVALSQYIIGGLQVGCIKE